MRFFLFIYWLLILFCLIESTCPILHFRGAVSNLKIVLPHADETRVHRKEEENHKEPQKSTSSSFHNKSRNKRGKSVCHDSLDGTWLADFSGIDSTHPANSDDRLFSFSFPLIHVCSRGKSKLPLHKMMNPSSLHRNYFFLFPSTVRQDSYIIQLLIPWRSFLCFLLFSWNHLLGEFPYFEDYASRWAAPAVFPPNKLQMAVHPGSIYFHTQVSIF